jgi:hypothetical protein
MDQPATVSMLEKTVGLLKSCGLPLNEVANTTGLGYEWLKKLKQGDIQDPGVNRIEKLHNFLTHRVRIDAIRHPLV